MIWGLVYLAGYLLSVMLLLKLRASNYGEVSVKDVIAILVCSVSSWLVVLLYLFEHHCDTVLWKSKE